MKTPLPRERRFAFRGKKVGNLEVNAG